MYFLYEHFEIIVIDAVTIVCKKNRNGS